MADDYNPDDIYAAMRKADAAGDGEAVKALAAHLQTLQAAPTQPNEAAFRAKMHDMLAAPTIDRAAVHKFIRDSGYTDTDPTVDKGIDYAIANPGHLPGLNVNGPGQGPDTRPTSFLTGAAEGLLKPIDNAASYLESAADKIGLAKPINALGSALGLAGSAEQANATQRQTFDNLDTQGSGAGKFVGETVGTGLLTRGMGGPITQGVVGGALLSDAKDGAGVVKDAVVGAVGGKVGDTLMRGVAHVVAPVVNPMVRRLIDAGVRLTPGQIVGQNGVVGRIVKKAEDLFGSIPISGPVVGAAHEKSVDDLNRVAVNRVLKPLNEALPDAIATGHDAIAYAGDKLKGAYNRILPSLSGTLDKSFSDRIETIMARAHVPPEYAAKLADIRTQLKNAFVTKSGEPGEFNGRTLRDASERLGDIAAGWRRADDPYLRQIGDVADQARAQLHALARRQNPAAAADLRAVDAGYANLVRVERAAAGTDTGVFQPGGLKTAVRQADGSVRKRQSARGQALMQDLSRDANVIMPPRTGHGGSKDVNSALGVGGLLAAASVGHPWAMKLVGAGTVGLAAYSPPAQALIRTALTHNAGPRATYVSNLIRKGVPLAAIAGTTGAVNAAH